MRRNILGAILLLLAAELLFAASALASELPALSYLGGAYAAGASKAAALPCAAETDQIVLVEHTSGSDAIVSFHEKVEDEWLRLYSTYGYVGKNGIDKVRAGDKRTPTGTYNLTTPFGILDDPGSAMPYTKLTPYHYWCGSSSSGYYNQFCDSRVNGRKGGKGDEILINYTGFYNYCLFIDYNADGTPGLGSCIFLHCIGSRSYTSGCVAIPEDVMREVVMWARPGIKIVIGAELPAAELGPVPLDAFEAAREPDGMVAFGDSSAGDDAYDAGNEWSDGNMASPAGFEAGGLSASPDPNGAAAQPETAASPDPAAAELPEAGYDPASGMPSDDGGIDSSGIAANSDGIPGDTVEPLGIVAAVSGDAFVRTGPGLMYMSLATMYRGERADYLGNTVADERGIDWYMISLRGATCWVSSMYTRLYLE